MLRSTLLRLSENKGFANWVVSNGTTRRMARRFVAGETLDEAIAAARECNNAGMLASLDYLGENVATISDAQHSRDAYLEIFERIAQEGLHANVSGKLTQLGLDINVEFCEGLALSIVERAAGFDNFLRIDMESSLYTQRTVDLVKRVRARNPAIGTVIQSYLYRSATDVADLLSYGCRIRLCKGAYKESEEVAYPRKEDVDANYIRLMQTLLSSGFYHGIATHDPRMIAATIRYAASQQISKDDFEFQMLYGVRSDLQRRLVKDGYRVRVYIPYGKDWFPYFMRRLAERPANVGFLVRNFFR
jgi:proline dehydrogenase